MELDRIYFYTATINQWIPLLKQEECKKTILSSLKYLTQKGCLKIYGFVVMPNHIHLILEAIALNGKEMPHTSFLKFTGHSFLKILRKISVDELVKFQVDDPNKLYEFWQKGSFAYEIFSPTIAFQKLNYIHNNPCQKKWMLADEPSSYSLSSCSFYECDVDNFGFLTRIEDRL